MPVQKGKKRKRVRRRSLLAGAAAPATETSSGATPVQQRGRRSRWQPPLWVNVAFGFAMFILGIVFTLIPQKGMGLQGKLILLVLYWLVAAFYLSRALRQYRARRESG